MAVKTYWVCTMCEHYQRAQAAGVYERDGCGKNSCFSPVAGGWFPDYAGVLRQGCDNMHRWCFFCGDDAVAGVRVQERYLGVCEVHLNHLRTRVRRAGGNVSDVYQEDEDKVWGCDDREVRTGENEDGG